MPSSITMTIRVRPDVQQKLARLAADTRRTKSFLAGEAVALYVERELSIIEGIKLGMEDAENGRLVDHDDAIAEIYAAIDAVSSAKGGKA